MSPALILHGGAGTLTPDLHDERARGLHRAFQAAWDVLRQQGAALDAVVRAVMVLEDDPVFNAGVGSCLNRAGEVEVDASVMDGTTFQTGAVGAVKQVRNPILLARTVMEAGPHVFLVGEGAERFARAHGVPAATADELITKRQLRRWQTAQTTGERGTVGAVALDHAGHLAAATSTGGIFNKLPGRVGDTAVIGAGTYADSALGAASATGYGEAIIRSTLTKTAVELLHDGRDPMQAARAAVALLQQRTGSEAGIILLDPFGRAGYAYNTPAMSVALLAGDRLVVRES